MAMVRLSFTAAALEMWWLAGRIFREEIRERTLSSLLLLPRSFGRVLLGKIGGCALMVDGTTMRLFKVVTRAASLPGSGLYRVPVFSPARLKHVEPYISGPLMVNGRD